MNANGLGLGGQAGEQIEEKRFKAKVGMIFHSKVKGKKMKKCGLI